MARQQHYSVQIIKGLSSARPPQCIAVDALSPVHAGQIVLGEVLSLQGPEASARAIVWRLADDFSPIGITLYDPMA